MDIPAQFNQEDTHKIQFEVRLLFASMSDEFREHLMQSFMWTQENLEHYLSREMLLEGNTLKDAYSHLESLLARIEGFAVEKPSREFPGYDEWINEEYHAYKQSLREDKEDIERLVDEGGVVSPGKISPVDVMEDDSLAHYNHLKIEHEKAERRSKDAAAIMASAPYRNLQDYSKRMYHMILESVNHH
jgi:hypothetical protein